MTYSSALDDSRLSVLLDLRHPLAYLALHPTLELARDEGLEVNWLPVRVPPLKVPSTVRPDDDRGIRHRRIRAQAIAREIETYADAQGLVLRDYYRDADPTAAYVGWLWLREQKRERLEDYLIEVFRAYWALELDPGDEGAISRIIDNLDADAAGFEAWAVDRGPACVSAVAEELSERGLSGAPVYMIDEEPFLGRQHLPMIRWMLGGREGPGPI
jgi:2-hydroxychromene-2-carboxylate isomerase